MKGKISEIFDSIQGEGIYLGRRQIFVRFFGCNLSCAFCDTPLEYFKEYEPQEVMAEIRKYPPDFHSVSFTGGEPLVQKDFLKALAMLTREAGIINYLETNGVLFSELADVIDYCDIVAMDLKLESSTGLNDYREEHRKFLKIAGRKAVFLKAVICSSTGEEDIRQAAALIEEVNRDVTLVLQPNSFEEGLQLRAKIEKFKEICAAGFIKVRVIPQMHKVAGVR